MVHEPRIEKIPLSLLRTAQELQALGALLSSAEGAAWNRTEAEGLGSLLNRMAARLSRMSHDLETASFKAKGDPNGTR